MFMNISNSHPRAGRNLWGTLSLLLTRSHLEIPWERSICFQYNTHSQGKFLYYLSKLNIRWRICSMFLFWSNSEWFALRYSIWSVFTNASNMIRYIFTKDWERLLQVDGKEGLPFLEPVSGGGWPCWPCWPPPSPFQESDAEEGGRLPGTRRSSLSPTRHSLLVIFITYC